MYTSKKHKVAVKVVKNPKQARAIVAALCNHNDVALDFETTSLFPLDNGRDKSARVRLTCLCWRPGYAVILDHDFCGSFASFADDLASSRPYYVFNNKFETKWFDTYTDNRVDCLDVGNMRRSVLGGGPLSLKTQVKRDLGIEMNKEQQLSDWSLRNLTPVQYMYAGLDAIRTYQLAKHWQAEMLPKHWSGFYVVNDSTRAAIEMEDTGMLLDEGYHQGLCDMWLKRKVTAEKAIRKIVSADILPNIRSKKQISDLLKSSLDHDTILGWPKTEKTAQLSTNKDVLREMSYRASYPLSRFLTALMVYNRAAAYHSSYGETLITKQQLSQDGRIHCRVNIAQAITGRLSTSGPNLQSQPHSVAVRRSYIAPKGQKIIGCDYSSIEVRVLAELSGDEGLLQDTIYGDVHSESAIAIFGLGRKKFMKAIKRGDPKAKAMRGKAKQFSFQLLYSAGAGALSIVLRSSYEEALDAIEAWAARYPKAFGHRQTVFEAMNVDGFIPTVSGRTIYVSRRDRDMPKAANFPIQGSAADVMYRAMHHIEKMLSKSKHRDHIQIAITVHDELLLYADKKYAKKAAKILKTAMVRGWLDMFRDTNTDNLADVGIGSNWAEVK